MIKKIFFINYFLLSFVLYSQAQSCFAGFTYSNNQGAVSFADSSFYTDSLLNATWDFGDGSGGTGLNATHTFIASGGYYVCYTIQTNSCTDTFCDSIYISIPVILCTADFSFVVASSDSLLYTFADNSSVSDSIYSLIWTSNGDTISFQNVFTFLFSDTGLYNVCLRISSNNCDDSICQTIHIIQNNFPCQAYFVVDSGLNCGPFCYQFIDSSTLSPSEQITSWQWNFGDNNTDTVPNPVHVFQNEDTFNVCLTIITSGNCTDTYCSQVEIISTPVCNAVFVIDSITPNCGAGCILFSDISSGSSPIVQRNWIFSDGFTSSDSSFTRTFTSSGTYTVCLYITSSTGCTDSICQTIIVNIPLICSASFSFSNTNCENCYDFSGYSPDTVVSWQWNFGNGATSNLQNPSYIFADSGLYIVCLTIVTSTGCTYTVCQNIYVNLTPSCNVDFTFSNNVCPNCFNFNDISEGTIISRAWDFGNGETSSLQNPYYVFPDSGNYNVCLTVQKTVGSDTLTCSECYTIYASENNISLFYLKGKVHAGSTLLNEGMAIIFKEQSGYYVPVQYQKLNSGTFDFRQLVQGKYIVFALPEPSAEQRYFASYFVNKLSWEKATEINVYANIIDLDIYLQPKPANQNGSGVISGIIYYEDILRYEKYIFGCNWFGENTVEIPGNYARNIPVYLYNTITGDSLQWALSDASGRFTFSGIEEGTYKINVQKPGILQNVSPLISISNTNPVNSNIAVTLRTNDVHFNLSGDAEMNFKNAINIYPNPVQTKLTIQFKTDIMFDEVSISIMNTIGQLIYFENNLYINSNQSITIPTNNLSTGIYLIKIQTGNKMYISKFQK
ncbi:MAG TPA: hypothetical protein DEH02_14540 [Bacteroidales bacterium]|nr:MAG: hypothetical protein A2X01_14125 [Bacteroidetes bacterium GWF2_35_48]HBX52279.1 hypothetical protein [Bacteroidales bacterium]